MPILRTCLVVALAAIMVGTAVPVRAQVSQVILILWHGAGLEDLAGLAPGEPQAWGIMNTRTGGGAGVEGAYLSISSGARAVGVTGAGAAFDREEDETYTRNTGLDPWAVVVPEIWRIRNGQNTAYTVRPGALGTALQAGWLRAAAYGNSDTDRSARWAAVVAADEVGRVSEGRVGRELLLEDVRRPFGVRTNYEQLRGWVQASTADLVVVDLGDPYRLDEASPALMPGQLDTLRRAVAAEARDFVSGLLEEVPPGTVVLVASPHPGREKAGLNQWLSPVVLFGWENGLLMSPTTKWPGIITNMDVAPTILKLLGAEPPSAMVGSPAAVSPAEPAEAQTAVLRLEERLIWLNTYRSPVLRALVGFQIGAYLAALTVMIAGIPFSERLIRFIQFLLVLALAVPACLLMMPLGTWAVLVLAAAVLALKLWRGRFLAVITGVAVATAALVGVDTVTGSSLMRFSFLGYDPIGGARFYGLGNEYMGILIGSLIMGWACLAQQLGWGKRAGAAAALPAFAAALVVIGAPWWGTNVGGAITAVLGFGVTLGALLRVRFSWRAVAVLLAAAALVLGAMMAVDARRAPDQQSHIGRTVQLLQKEGLLALYLIVQRKLSMNLRLLRYSIWSRAWLAAMVLMGASFVRPSRFVGWLTKEYPQIANGIWGTVVAGTAALAFNDSGIVAAATCVFFAATTMAVLALDYKLLEHDLLPAQAHIEDDTDRH